ncbi:MAG TPA: sulfite exporter TauE/SafE family protein [Acidimicrobiia bacterium]|nr:sulfite exporter TauE/SafE family protein [Acidimicrobiia bacterium]
MEGDLFLILGAVTLGFFVKGVTGMGGPMLSTPLIAATTSVEHAVVVVSFANLLSNLWLIWENRRAGSGLRWLLVPMLSAGVVGTVVGTWLLTELDDRILSWTLAAVVFLYILRFLFRPDVRLEKPAARRLAVPVGLSGGLLTGGTGIGGPVFATYLHGLRLERSTFVLVSGLIFGLLSPIQIGLLASWGVFDSGRLVQAALALVPVLIVTPVGMAVSRRLPQRVFEYVVLFLLAYSAIRLVT